MNTKEELFDNQLEKIAGGWGYDGIGCHNCGSPTMHIEYYKDSNKITRVAYVKCNKCGYYCNDYNTLNT